MSSSAEDVRGVARDWKRTIKMRDGVISGVSLILGAEG